MFILTISGQQTEGAYAVTDPDGERALYLFEEEDDAERYAGLLEAEDGIRDDLGSRGLGDVYKRQLLS